TAAATLLVVTVGVSGALVGGEGGGVALAGAGSGSASRTRNRVKASITGGSTVTNTGRSAATLTATDSSIITAAAGAAALAVAGGGGEGTSATLSFSLAANDISNSVTASIDGSTVSSEGGVSLGATAQETILAITAAGSVAGSAGEGGGRAFAGVG